LRGGDRPKNAHDEFFDVTVMPKSCWEPWGLFRKPCEGRVQDNLRKWKTGGLRRISASEPFKDLIRSSIAPKKEREIAPHPSLKPQNFLRQIVRASLPLSVGTILDPFMGSGSTIAAAEACGLESIGLEIRSEYFTIAKSAIPKLAALDAEMSKRFKEDWKYEGSSAGSEGGGRTHTFGLKLPAKRLKDKAVYQRKDVKLIGGKAVPRNGD
jgi:DNA modification methylase